MFPSLSKPRPPVTARAVLLGLALIPLNAYWVILSELRWYTILTLNPLFVTPVFFLLILLGVNGVLHRLRPQWAFSISELLTVYVMLAISCTVSTHDFVINLMTTIGWGAWFATPENRWAEVIHPYTPKWAVVWDHAALRGFMEGDESPYRLSVLSVWAGPVLIWVAFMLVLFATMYCLNTLVRKAWIEETKLSFPIVRLPLAMVGLDSTGFFRSRAMWIGLVLPLLSGTLNGLAKLYPTVPHIQTRAIFHSFPNPPWNLINGTPSSLYPFAIGLGYFVPLDVLFSCWFFYLFIKLESILGYYVGLTRVPGYPFAMEQGIGAWTTYGILILYVTRRHWQRVLGAILNREPLGDGGELLSYRTAFYGVVAGLVLVIAFWRMVGMSLLPATIVVVIYFLLALCITRVRAEAGSQHTVWDLEPMNLFALVDSRSLSKGDMIGAGLSHWFWRLNRSHAMPTQLEALKMWHEAGLTPRTLAWPIIVSTIASSLAGPWAVLHVAYRDGAAAKCIGYARWTGFEIYGWLQNMMGPGKRFEWPRLLTVGLSSGLTLLLWGLQTRYTWLWLHPLGYCAGPGLIWVWFPFMIAWIVKSLIIRYGGRSSYRKAIPFFLGLVLGDYVSGSLWAIIGPLFNFEGYQIFH